MIRHRYPRVITPAIRENLNAARTINKALKQKTEPAAHYRGPASGFVSPPERAGFDRQWRHGTGPVSV